MGIALIVPVTALANSSGAAVQRATPHAPPNVTVTLGTTDRITSLDPAGSYDLPSWTIIYNVYQTLLKYIPSTTTIVSDAGTCAWKGTGAVTYVCTVKPKQFFSNGDPVTAADVAYSFNRINKIKSSTGPASLIAPMKSVSYSGNTVTFKLKSADATWPDVLTTGAGAIVDAKVYPFNKLQPSTAGKIIGSGPYYLSSYTTNQLAVFKPNARYGGNDVLHNNEFIVRYEESGSTLVSDLQSDAVDIAYRELSPTQLIALEKSKGVTVDQGKGIEIRYIVFNLKTQPGKTTAQKHAIRQAVAYLINRQDIVTHVYRGTVKPLYSIIADALPGHINSFADVYGTSPSVAKAKAVLKSAGVKTPVKLTLWYNTDHYGDTDLATELQRQIDTGGLFSVSLNTAAWATYVSAGTTNQYGVSLFGWFPDYPDADDYTGPFYLCNMAWMNDHYCNMQVNKYIAEEEASTVQSVRNVAFAKLQTLTAKDAPLIPLWQGGQVAGVRDNVTGVLSTLDASYTFRFWLIGKS
ncbi:MAG TPA: ABC transporter substrate-binding protein [Acidimicrobiales bacterium]|nr:ABC transporter substrate-binding protein [Acidimicrobiales bacterium]